MAKKIFRKDNVVNTAISVAMGGVANVAVDYARASVDALATMDDKWYNLAKFGVGVVGSTMIGNRYAKDALNGLAVVGISNFAQSMLDQPAPAGVPAGTVGRRPRLYARNLRSSYAQKQKGTPSAYIS